MYLLRLCDLGHMWHTGTVCAFMLTQSCDLTGCMYAFMLSQTCNPSIYICICVFCHVGYIIHVELMHVRSCHSDKLDIEMKW